MTDRVRGAGRYSVRTKLLATLGGALAGLAVFELVMVAIPALGEHTWSRPRPGAQLLLPTESLALPVLMVGLPIAIAGAFIVGLPLWSLMERLSKGARNGRLWASLVTGVIASPLVTLLALAMLEPSSLLGFPEWSSLAFYFPPIAIATVGGSVAAWWVAERLRLRAG